MSRLIFAAARGARIETFSRYSLTWQFAYSATLAPYKASYSQRIHPDDEHLQYGPISTALREAAAAGNKWDLTGATGRAADAYASYNAVWWYSTEMDRSLYLLILAEALADEGL